MIESFKTWSDQLIDRALSQGAEQVKVSLGYNQGSSVEVHGKSLEEIESSQSMGATLTVYQAHKASHVSCGMLTPALMTKLVDKAIAQLAVTQPDEAEGLAEREQLCHDKRDLSLDHPCDLSTETMIEEAMAQAIKIDSHPEIQCCDSSVVSQERSYYWQANSEGFSHSEWQTCYARHAVAVALGQDKEPVRDSEFGRSRQWPTCPSADWVAEKTIECTLAKRGAVVMPTQTARVLIDASAAKTFWRYLLSGISGGPLYQQTTCLAGTLGQALLPAHIHIDEDPFLLQGWGSAVCDEDGLARCAQPLVDSGVIQTYLLSLYSARRLKESPTGHGGGISNVLVRPTHKGGHEAALKSLGTGLLITSFMGQGLHLASGDYSCGISGFWVENGVITTPVHNMTMASDLKTMLGSVEAVFDDVDTRSALQTGSVLLPTVMLSGA